MTTTTATATSLPGPRRKARVKDVPGASLPTPWSIPGLPFTHYEATYSQGHITVHHPKQAQALWHNGYFGHGMAAGGGSGRYKGNKKWRLVEADGLKSGKWFKEIHKTRMWRGEVEAGGEEVQKVVEMEDLHGNKEEEDEEVVNMKKKEVERNEEMKDLREKNCKDKKMEEKLIAEREEKNDNDRERERRNMKEKEDKAKEERRKNTVIKGIENSNEEYIDNDKEELEMISDGEEHEPWRTVLVLSGDQEKDTATHNSNAYLSLLPEEALFLSYALGCLVLSHQETPSTSNPKKRSLQQHNVHQMTIDEMWRLFSEDDPAFPVKYAAFHHFRSQGWVVKAGLKYGVDYVLYPVGPPFYHSQYAVKVHSLWADTLTLDHTLPGHTLTWTTTATTERLANHVNKTPVMCLVLRPRSLTAPRLTHIECLKELKVQEMVIARWNPSDGTG